MEFERLLPQDIERRSFEIISSELGYEPEPRLAPIIKRVIHTTADFDYAKALYFSENAVEIALQALQGGALIVTDTNMGLSGINREAQKQLGVEAVCYMADDDVAATAKEKGSTRASAAVDKALMKYKESPNRPLIMAVGNAPTALMRMHELFEAQKLSPTLVIAAPVGFVNVVQAKEQIIADGLPVIAVRGRKGGSAVAATIVNALMYMLTRKEA